MGFAAAIVVAAAVPVGLSAWFRARRVGQPICPRWRPPAPRWTGLEVLILFLLFNLLTPLVMAVLTQTGFYSQVLPPTALNKGRSAALVAVAGGTAAEVDPDTIPTRVREGMWASFLAVPLLLLAGQGLRSAVGPGDPRVFAPPRMAANVALGVAAWAVLTPVVFSVYFMTQQVVLSPGEKPDTHPLVLLGAARRTIDLVVFLLSTCVFVPLGEEFLFRGVFIPWAARARFGPATLFAVAVLFAVWESSTAAGLRLAPIGFVAVLGIGLALIALRGRTGRRPVRIPAAVYSSSAFFAAVHTNIWPTPVPLFVLGVGLGYLVVRTRSLLPAVIVHGLFNAVSAVLVLSGDAGG
jgi:membrane protease YdiL (CAAX protease family)